MKTSKPLAKPHFKHAVEGVVKVSELPDPAKAEVAQYENHQAGDEVKFEVTTSTGNTWTETIVLTSGQSFPLGFAIPKSTFKKGLTAGATAKMQYMVSRGGNQVYSESLELALVPK